MTFGTPLQPRLTGRGLVFAALALVIALSSAGCKDESGTGGNPAAGPSTSGTGGAEKKLRLAFVTNNASDFWTIAKAGVNKAKEEIGNVDVTVQLPSAGTAADQKRILDDLLAKGIDGIAVSPVDPVNEVEELNKVARQALLFTQDSDAPNTNRACYVGTDNVAAGRQAGGLIKQALPEGGKIMLFVGKRDAQNAREREQGIREALAGSNVEVLDVKTDDVDRVRAKSNVSDTLVKYPDIACLVGLWSYNGPAIVNATRAAGKTGKVKIVCFDEEDDTLDGVKKGDIYSTVVQQPYEFGRQAMVVMAKHLRGDKSAIPADKKIIVPTLAIDQKNVEEFAAKLKTLRGK